MAYAATSIALLQESGYSLAEIIALAKLRTAVTNLAQFGVNQRINDQWQAGADFMISNTSGTPPSGSQYTTTYTNTVTDAQGNITTEQTNVTTTGPEGYLPGTLASGNTKTLSGRLSANNLVATRDLSTFNLSYTVSPGSNARYLSFNSRVFSSDTWTFDGTVGYFLQYTKNIDSASNLNTSSQKRISPVTRVSYLMHSNLTIEGELGADFSWYRYSSLQPSRINRLYCSTGFRLDF